MSNILEQAGISFVPINKNKTTNDYISDFCNFLNNIKTPIDIFEQVQINDLKFVYAAEYVVCVDATLNWEAKTTKVVDGDIIQSIDQDHTDCTVAATAPANTNELDALNNGFFVDSSYILMSLVQEITEDIKLIKENELGNEAIEFCQSNTADIENFDMKSIINTQINSRADEIYKNKYNDCHYEITAVDVNMSEPSIFSVLIPVLFVNYSYCGNVYHCIINAHSDKKSTLLNHKNIYIGTLPEDTSKEKGLFGKIKSAANKLKHKNQQKSVYESKFILEFEKYIK